MFIFLLYFLLMFIIINGVVLFDFILFFVWLIKLFFENMVK